MGSGTPNVRGSLKRALLVTETGLDRLRVAEPVRRRDNDRDWREECEEYDERPLEATVNSESGKERASVGVSARRQ